MLTKTLYQSVMCNSYPSDLLLQSVCVDPVRETKDCNQEHTAFLIWTLFFIATGIFDKKTFRTLPTWSYTGGIHCILTDLRGTMIQKSFFLYYFFLKSPPVSRNRISK
jgi:hypothetical protein